MIIAINRIKDPPDLFSSATKPQTVRELEASHVEVPFLHSSYHFCRPVDCQFSGIRSVRQSFRRKAAPSDSSIIGSHHLLLSRVGNYRLSQRAESYAVEAERHAQVEQLKKQSAGGGYTITLHDDRATVSDEFMKESYDFIVYERRADGVILIRPKGVGVEVITIDPVNGSFVLTDAGVQTLWNRANVWTGRCS